MNLRPPTTTLPLLVIPFLLPMLAAADTTATFQVQVQLQDLHPKVVQAAVECGVAIYGSPLASSGSDAPGATDPFSPRNDARRASARSSVMLASGAYSGPVTVSVPVPASLFAQVQPPYYYRSGCQLLVLGGGKDASFELAIPAADLNPLPVTNDNQRMVHRDSNHRWPPFANYQAAQVPKPWPAATP